MKTFVAKSKDCKKKWYIIDANGKTLGRLATKIVYFLRGKNKIEYTPHVDIGDYVIVLNASKIIVTGNKRKNKIYYRHTGYVGGIKQMSFEDMLNKRPEQVIRLAVKGMLPKGPLGKSMIQKMKVYSGNEHVHNAQQPLLLNI